MSKRILKINYGQTLRGVGKSNKLVKELSLEGEALEWMS